MSDAVAKRLFYVSMVFIAAAVLFGYGLATERYQIWPYSLIHETIRVAKSYREYGAVVPEGRRVEAPPGAARTTFSAHAPDRMLDGYYAIAGWNDDRGLFGAWLYDSNGALINTWDFDYYALDPDGPWNGEDHPHPIYVLPDGSLIVAFDSGDIMARLDACSAPIWIKDGIYHHSLARADDGSFWTWRGDGTPYGHYHYIENFEADTGKTIREIRLVEDIIQKAGPQAAVFNVRPDFPFRRWERNPVFLALNDVFHPNDVEPLGSDMASAFPMFEAGDLLISLRNVDLVAVIDPRSYEVKWWSQGPWRMQHDPDFTADGMISVFNNNTDRGRSEIIKIDPATMEFTNELYYGDARFYTGTMGKQQYLPNGNVLVVVPDEGRVLEFTSDGRPVMEFNNLAPGSMRHNDHVEDGMWFPADYFDTVPACTAN